jgi:hypothetical protein
MLTLKSSFHIRTSQQIKGFRSCATSSGLPMRRVEAGRLYRGRIVLATRRQRRSWLEEQWLTRFEHEGERLRVLPPSARYGQRKAT